MFKENNLTQVNFPANLIGKEFSNLLDKTQDNLNVNAAQSTDPPTEVINANNTVKSKVTNDMDLEFHNKCAREENSPVASRKKRETVTEMERESEDEIINVAKPQSQRPEIAPKPQPLSQRDPRLLASAARARERESESERRKSGRSRERDEARDHSRSSSYTRIPDINYANTDKVQLHFYVKDSDDIDLTTSNPDTYDQIKRAVVNRTAKFHWHCPTFSYEKIFVALISNNIDWGKVQLSKMSDDRVRAMKNELCNQ